MNKNIAAWTSPDTSYPEFVSINQVGESYDVRIIVRSPKLGDGKCGETVSVLLTGQQFADLLAQANKAFPPAF